MSSANEVAFCCFLLNFRSSVNIFLLVLLLLFFNSCGFVFFRGPFTVIALELHEGAEVDVCAEFAIESEVLSPRLVGFNFSVFSLFPPDCLRAFT